MSRHREDGALGTQQLLMLERLIEQAQVHAKDTRWQERRALESLVSRCLATVDVGHRTWTAIEGYWTTWGPVTGTCGHVHATQEEAEACIGRHGACMRAVGGYSDRHLRVQRPGSPCTLLSFQVGTGPGLRYGTAPEPVQTDSWTFWTNAPEALDWHVRTLAKDGDWRQLRWTTTTESSRQAQLLHYQQAGYQVRARAAQ